MALRLPSLLSVYERTSPLIVKVNSSLPAGPICLMTGVFFIGILQEKNSLGAVWIWAIGKPLRPEPTIREFGVCGRLRRLVETESALF